MGFDMYLFDANEPELVEFLVSLKSCLAYKKLVSFCLFWAPNIVGGAVWPP